MADRLLSGRTALVTGASGAIGKATAIRLAKMGADVIVHGRNKARTEAAAEAVRAEGVQAHLVMGELGNASATEAVIAEVRTHSPAIDVLVNNAGGESSQDGMGPWFEVSAEEWLATYESNLGSMVRLTQAFAPGMMERRWGRVIPALERQRAGADADHTRLSGREGPQCATLARTLAKAMVRTGVTANSVSPGFVLTDTNRVWLVKMAAKAGIAGDDWAAIEKWAVEKFVPNGSGRLGVADDIGHVIAFLASPDAGYVNGIDIQVDGG